MTKQSKPRNNKEKGQKPTSGYKLQEKHINFICKKIAEENMCGAQIADLFNSVFGPKGNKKGITISYQWVYHMKAQPQYQQLIHDYKMQYAKEVNLNKYCDLSFCSQVLMEVIEEARHNKNYRSTIEGIRLLSGLNGKVTENVNHQYTDEELRERIQKMEEDKKNWYVEYVPPSQINQQMPEENAQNDEN